MPRQFKADPFETSPEEKAANLARAKAERIRGGRPTRKERWQALGTGEDGTLLNIVMDGADRATKDDGPLDQMTEGAFGDPDAEIGGLVAGIDHRLRGDRQ